MHCFFTSKRGVLSLLTLLLGSLAASAMLAAKPLFRDPVYDGAADPVLVWNPQEMKWFMFYTNRRASATNLPGVSWVHGTRIGIAESSDSGATWSYRGTANMDLGEGEYSQWAPEIVEHEGVWHMYLTFVPGMHTDWSGTREMVHLTSTNLLDWRKESTLPLASHRVIDACVIRMPNGSWRMWYNNEPDKKAIYYADSPDLYQWTDKGKAVGDRAGEGPKVFFWKGKYWMIVDNWRGLGVYSSNDLTDWKRLEANLLEAPGHGTDDQVKGGHADVVVSEGRAYLFYFTHPGRQGLGQRLDGSEQRRSSIQVTELKHRDGLLTCDRDEPLEIRLAPPGHTYLFTYFVSNGEDGLHLAWSQDGYRWQALNEGRSFLQPKVGESKLMRDPCAILGSDGRFHMVWTTAWNGRTIGYAHTKDFVNWSEQRALPVMADEPATLNCWAPELLWDEQRAEYLIFWASTVTNRFLETAGASEGKYNHRMYSTTTRDFKQFSTTELFYDPGFNVIDATILRAGGRFYMFIKDETVVPPKKHLRIAEARRPSGPWSELGPAFTRSWVEGPTCLTLPTEYIVYFDLYRDHRYGAMVSKDLVHWKNVSQRLAMPKGLRHGTALRVSPSLIADLLQVRSTQ